MTVKPNDHVLSVNRYPRSLHKEVAAGTVVAAVVVTAPIWGPYALRLARAAPAVAQTAARVRVVADAVVGPQVRVEIENKAMELLHDEAEELGKQGLRMFIE